MDTPLVDIVSERRRGVAQRQIGPQLSKTARRNRKRNVKKRLARIQKVDARTLPVTAKDSVIVQTVRTHQVVIIVAETGCGKSSQVPQILLKNGLSGEGIIACTQPRRVAARSVAERVAEELKVELGTKVGYHVRFDNSTTKLTKIKFMTDGILLRECLFNVDRLRKYSVIIIDEVHERSLQMDMLFGFMKKLLPVRPDLKLIIMSATMNALSISEYYNKAPVLNITGSSHPVKIEYSPGFTNAHILSVISKIRTQEPGDIMVFLPGVIEIGQLREVLRKDNRLHVVPAYSQLPPWELDKIFTPSPDGKRKVILSTNVTESSLTLPGLRYVIDTGYVNVKVFDGKTGVNSLETRLISKSEAEQRKGRVGRTAPGVCYRLYHKHQLESGPLNEEEEKKKVITERRLRDYPQPQIEVDDLSHVVLILKLKGFKAIDDFPFLSHPNASNVETGIQELRKLGALDTRDAITKKGRHMVAFPLHPRLAAALLEAKKQGCEFGMLLLASILSVFNGGRQRSLAKLAHAKYGQMPDEVSVVMHMMKDFLDAEETDDIDGEFFSKVNIRLDLVYEAIKTYYQLHRILEDRNFIIRTPQTTAVNADDSEKMFAVHQILSRIFASNVVKPRTTDSNSELTLPNGTVVLRDSPLSRMPASPESRFGAIELFQMKDIRSVRQDVSIRMTNTFLASK